MRGLSPVLVLVLLAGCAPATTTPRALEILDVANGEPVSFDAMIERLAEARVVYVGERHDEPADHVAQAQIASALLARGGLAIGFEMVQRPYQAGLDEYAAGAIDEAALRERVEWGERWGFGFEMYQPLFALGPERGARLLALNAPRELTRAVARGGVESLEPEARARLPELDLGDAAHRAMIEEALAHHPGMSEARFERFYAAQVLWDETMAETVAAALAASGGPARVLVIAGGMHARRPAIPLRAARRGAAPYAIVLCADADELPSLRERGDADFLWVTR